MKRLILTLPLALYPLLTGCPTTAEPPPPPPPAAVRTAPRQAPPPAAGTRTAEVGTTTLPAKPVAGSALNKFFPQGVTYTQEKAGYSMANLKGGGTMAIADLASNPPARDKFKSSTETMAGYPAVKQGTQGVQILVGDRFQVTVRGAANAEGALGSANLSGLAGLK